MGASGGEKEEEGEKGEGPGAASAVMPLQESCVLNVTSNVCRAQSVDIHN